MAQTEQEKLLGAHPVAPHIYGMWLNSTDLPASVNKKHRKTEEIDGTRDAAINALAQWIVNYHVHNHSKNVIARKRAILKKHELDDFIDKMKLLPKAENTKKGNLGEIILIEYLKASRGFDPIVHKLQYNTNVDSAMKGDDVLMFNTKDLFSEVMYGECKFRSIPSKQVVEDIVNNLEGAKGLPASLEFVANILADRGETDLADNITELHIKIEDGSVPVTNVGFLISTKSDVTAGLDTTKQIEKHLKTSNPRLVMISLGIDNPAQVVDEAFKRADDIIKML